MRNMVISEEIELFITQDAFKAKRGVFEEGENERVRKKRRTDRREKKEYRQRRKLITVALGSRTKIPSEVSFNNK